MFSRCRSSCVATSATGVPECVDFGILLPDQADVDRIAAYRVGDSIKVIIPKCGIPTECTSPESLARPRRQWT